MNREIGFALKVLQILADERIPFEHMPSGIDSLSIVMRQEVFAPDKEKVITRRLVEELGIEKISVDRNLAIVMIVGEAMARTVGVTARAANALSKAGVNLEIINQGVIGNQRHVRRPRRILQLCRQGAVQRVFYEIDF